MSVTVANLKTAHISVLAQMIRDDWANTHYTARPYLESMLHIKNIDDEYGAENGRSVVTYFLNNAGSWRGALAKQIKAEFKRRLKLQPGEIPLDDELVKKVRPVIYATWEQIAHDVIECMGGQKLKNIEAIEGALDGNYPSMYGGPTGKEVDEMMSKVFQFHGPDKVLRFLNKNISLDTSI